MNSFPFIPSAQAALVSQGGDSSGVEGEFPGITVGVVTYDKDLTEFTAFCRGVTPALKHYEGKVELLVANNGGIDFEQKLIDVITEHLEFDPASVRVMTSLKNNISTARNLILEEARYQWLAFLDDDECPESGWLTELMATRALHNCDVVAGPAIAHYPPGTKPWIRDLDIHNSRDKGEGDLLNFCGCCNVMLDRQVVGKLRFRESFGESGGEDTDFFYRLHKQGANIVWSDEARVHETIPASNATFSYLCRRFMKQGDVYLRIMHEQGAIPSAILHRGKSLLVVLVSGATGVVLLALRKDNASVWIKRALTNLGKVFPRSTALYGTDAGVGKP